MPQAGALTSQANIPKDQQTRNAHVINREILQNQLQGTVSASSISHIVETVALALLNPGMAHALHLNNT
jgi:hypothetical protein